MQTAMVVAGGGAERTRILVDGRGLTANMHGSNAGPRDRFEGALEIDSILYGY